MSLEMTPLINRIWLSTTYLILKNTTTLKCGTVTQNHCK